MTIEVRKRLDDVRAAVAIAREKLAPREDKEFLGELLADAEGWRMELEEMEVDDA